LKWESRSQKLEAAAIGAAVAFVPFLVEKPSTIAIGAYVAILAVVIFISRRDGDAADDTRAERIESVSAIKEHIDKHLLPPALENTGTENGSERDSELGGRASSEYVE
jgi:hypothetical protein